MQREAFELMERQQSSHWWFVARRKIVSGLIERHCKLKPNAQILEAGCGSGGNLDMLSRFGEIRAFEHDPDARTAAVRRTGLPVTPGTLPDDFDAPNAYFDLIAMLDVLEHIDDDLASLEALKSKLAPHGNILITVPAGPWLWSDHDILHHHKRRYTKHQLEIALKSAGLHTVKIGYFNFLLFPLAIFDRVLVNLGLKTKTASDHPGRLINRLLTKIFGFELGLMKFAPLPTGLSLYAIARNG